MDRLGDSGPLLSGDALGRRKFLQGVAATGMTVTAGGLLVGCGGSSKSPSPVAKSTGQRHGGNLKVGLSGSSGADTLDPHQGLTYLDTARAQALYEPLVQLDKNAQFEYILAEEGGIKPHNGTNTEFVINLRKGITFHSGKELTAEDVIFTFRRIKTGNKGAGFAGANSLGPMDLNGLKALDKHTVLVPMTSPYGSFIDQLAFWYYLYIVPDGYDPKQPPNGTGPFVYQSFTPQQRSVFTRNKNFWKPGLPYVDSLTIIDFSDNVSLQDALVTGVIQAAGALEGPQLAALANTAGVKTVASHTGAIIPFTMRVDQKPFNHPNVRQALRLLVDRQQMIDSALDGYAVVGNDVFSPYDPDYNHSLRREADIPQAKALLKAIGMEDLTVTLTTAPVATGTVAMATVLAQQAKAAGVTIKVSNVSANTFFLPNKYLNWTFSQDFYNYSPYLAQVAQSMLKTSPYNETHTDNPQLNAWYADANKTTSTSTRKEIEQEMQNFDFTQGGYIIPAFIDTLDAYSTKITGYTPVRVGQPLSNVTFEKYSFV